jgi:hypothetical protein
MSQYLLVMHLQHQGLPSFLRRGDYKFTHVLFQLVIPFVPLYKRGDMRTAYKRG